MPGEKAWGQAVQMDNYAVVLGGEREGYRSCRRVYAFNTVHEVWDEWVSTINNNCGAASDGVRLIVVGGAPPSSHEPASDVYELNQAHNGWFRLPSMPKACNCCSATILRKKLYVLGNKTVKDTRGTIIQVMDFQDGAWSEIILSSAIPSRVSSGLRKHCLTALDDFIVSDQLVAYDMRSGQSKDLPSRPDSKPDTIQTLAVVAGRLLAFGKAELPSSKKVHMLSSDHRRWEELPSMTTARSIPAACTVNGVLYVFGGSDDYCSPLRIAECFK